MIISHTFSLSFEHQPCHLPLFWTSAMSSSSLSNISHAIFPLLRTSAMPSSLSYEHQPCHLPSYEHQPCHLPSLMIISHAIFLLTNISHAIFLLLWTSAMPSSFLRTSAMPSSFLRTSAMPSSSLTNSSHAIFLSYEHQPCHLPSLTNISHTIFLCSTNCLFCINFIRWLNSSTVSRGLFLYWCSVDSMFCCWVKSNILLAVFLCFRNSSLLSLIITVFHAWINFVPLFIATGLAV